MTDADDRLVLGLALVGAGAALAGIHAMPTLATGVTIGAAAVILAVRGRRPVWARRLMWSALTIATCALVGAAVTAYYEEWQIGLTLADSTSPHDLALAVRGSTRVATFLRSVALAAAIVLVGGALRARFGAGSSPEKQKGPGTTPSPLE